MHAEELFTANRWRPCVPLQVHVSDGASYNVRHPDPILGKRRPVILAWPDDPNSIPEHALTIDTADASRKEEIDEAASALA